MSLKKNNKNNILWEGKPSLFPFIFYNTKYLFISSVWCLFIGYYLILLDPAKFSMQGLIISLIALSPAISLPFYLGYRYFLCNQILYTIGNKSIQIHKGHQSKSLKYSDIGSFTIHRTIFRSSKNIGTISIFKGREKDSFDRNKLVLIAVENGFEIFKKIKDLTNGKKNLNDEYNDSEIMKNNKSSLKLFLKMGLNDENILWLEKPHLLPFVFQDGMRLLLMIIVPVAALLYIFNEISIIHNIEPEIIPATIPLIALATGFLFRAMHLISYRYFECTHVIYAWTNKSVIIKRGILLSNVTVLNYKFICEPRIEISATEKVFKAGTIIIFTGKYRDFIGKNLQILYENIFDELVAVRKPFEVVTRMKKLVN